MKTSWVVAFSHLLVALTLSFVAFIFHLILLCSSLFLIFRYNLLNTLFVNYPLNQMVVLDFKFSVVVLRFLRLYRWFSLRISYWLTFIGSHAGSYFPNRTASYSKDNNLERGEWFQPSLYAMIASFNSTFLYKLSFLCPID